MPLDSLNKPNLTYFNNRNEQSCWSLHCAMLTSTTDKKLVLDSEFHCNLLHYLLHEQSAEDTKIFVNNSLTEREKYECCMF